MPLSERDINSAREHARELTPEARFAKKMERNVFFIQNIYHAFESFPVNLSPSELDQRLAEEREKLFSHLSAEEIQNYQHHQQLARELKLLQEKIDATLLELCPEEDEDSDEVETKEQVMKKMRALAIASNSEEMTEMNDAQERLIEEMELIEEKTDIDLLEKVDCYLRSAREKYIKVRAYEADHRLFVQAIRRAVAHPQEISSRLVEMRFAPFEVTVVINDVLKNNPQEGASAAGIFLKDQPICLVQARENRPPVNLEEIISHERMHSFFDFTHSISLDPNELFASRQQRRERLISLDAPEMVINNETELLLDADKYIDALHEEFIAELETAERGSFRNAFYNNVPLDDTGDSFLLAFLRPGEETVDPNDLQQKKVFKRVCAATATAGHRSAKFYKTLTAASKNESNPALKKKLLETRDRFMKSYIAITMHAYDALRIGQRIGGDVEEFAHVLLFLLPATEFGSAQQILRAHCGEKAVNEAGEMNRFFDGFSLDREAIELFASQELLLSKLNREDQALLRERILTAFEDFELNNSNAIGVTTYADLTTYQANMSGILKHLNITEEEHTSVIERIGQIFFEYTIDAIDHSGEKKFDELLAGLDIAHKKEIDFALAVHESFVMEDLYERFGQAPSREAFEQTAYWRLASFIGEQKKFDVFTSAT